MKNLQVGARTSESMRGGIANTVKTEDRIIPQIDLFKIHHFDNKTKTQV